MSELVTDLDQWVATRYPNADEDWGPAGGRHAYNEDAALTPIFHALTRGDRRSRQYEPTAPTRTADPMDEFRRDPLTAPIPASTRARRHPERPEGGRHHRTPEAPRW